MTHLIFDVGNSRIKAAVFRDQEIVLRRTIEYRPENGSDEFSGTIESLLAAHAVERIGMASVVPEKAADLRTALRRHIETEPFIVEASARLPFMLRYLTPNTLGADRIAAACAAWTIFGEPTGRSVVAVDAGTATTYDIVTDGVYLGGAIAPGPKVMSIALGSGGAQLPTVEVDTDLPPPVGRTTHEAIRAGIMLGYIDAVNGMLQRLKEELSDDSVIVLTGGWAELLHPNIADPHKCDTDLVLRGVDILLHLNP